MKKNGFIAISLIYTFFILFLVLMLYVFNSYSRNKYLLDSFKNEIKQDFFESESADINLYFYVYNEETGSYELEKEINQSDYEFVERESFCTGEDNEIIAEENEIKVSAKSGTICKAYFKRKPRTTNEILIYIKEGDNSSLVSDIPDSRYTFIESESTCENGTISFDTEEREFVIASEEPTTCEAVFELGG